MAGIQLSSTPPHTKNQKKLYDDNNNKTVYITIIFILKNINNTTIIIDISSNLVECIFIIIQIKLKNKNIIKGDKKVWFCGAVGCRRYCLLCVEAHLFIRSKNRKQSKKIMW